MGAQNCLLSDPEMARRRASRSPGGRKCVSGTVSSSELLRTYRPGAPGNRPCPPIPRTGAYGEPPAIECTRDVHSSSRLEGPRHLAPTGCVRSENEAGRLGARMVAVLRRLG